MILNNHSALYFCACLKYSDKCLILIKCCSYAQYRDRNVRADSVDNDQTAFRGAV